MGVGMMMMGVRRGGIKCLRRDLMVHGRAMNKRMREMGGCIGRGVVVWMMRRCGGNGELGRGLK